MTKIENNVFMLYVMLIVNEFCRVTYKSKLCL